MPDWTQIAAAISKASNQPFHPRSPQNQGGGCINTAVTLADGASSWFVKLNAVNQLPMFEAEAAGLQALADSNSIRVPKPLCTGTTAEHAFIVMEQLELRAGSTAEQSLAGEQLAALHQHRNTLFGWERENTIGATAQHNDYMDDWIEFWREHRLGFQLRLAITNGYGGNLQDDGERLLGSFQHLLDHAPVASLLHGDLWGGNLSFSKEGQPVIYDPATYFGDREAELAMTELFGGFSNRFYQAYTATLPMSAGYPAHKRLYNLYHVLNHLNLFGSGYLGQAQRMIGQLLAEIG